MYSLPKKTNILQKQIITNSRTTVWLLVSFNVNQLTAIQSLSESQVSLGQEQIYVSPELGECAFSTQLDHI